MLVSKRLEAWKNKDTEGSLDLLKGHTTFPYNYTDDEDEISVIRDSFRLLKTC